MGTVGSRLYRAELDKIDLQKQLDEWCGGGYWVGLLGAAFARTVVLSILCMSAQKTSPCTFDWGFRQL